MKVKRDEVQEIYIGTILYCVTFASTVIALGQA